MIKVNMLDCTSKIKCLQTYWHESLQVFRYILYIPFGIKWHSVTRTFTANSWSEFLTYKNSQIYYCIVQSLKYTYNFHSDQASKTSHSHCMGEWGIEKKKKKAVCSYTKLLSTTFDYYHFTCTTVHIAILSTTGV